MRRADSPACHGLRNREIFPSCPKPTRRLQALRARSHRLKHDREIDGIHNRVAVQITRIVGRNRPPRREKNREVACVDDAIAIKIRRPLRWREVTAGVVGVARISDTVAIAVFLHGIADIGAVVERIDNRIKICVGARITACRRETVAAKIRSDDEEA